MNKFSLIVFTFFLISCNDNKANQINKRLELIPNPDIGLELFNQKSDVDSTLIKNKNAIRYIVTKENLKPKKIKMDNHKYEEYDVQYFIYKDLSNTIVAVTEVPYSESGDWFLEMTHYFDNNGQVYACQKQLNTFHHADVCGDDDVLFVKTIEYFNNGLSIGKGKTLKNRKGIEFKEDICAYNDVDMPIFKNLTDWLNASKIEDKQ